MIEVKDLSFSYGSREVLRDISLSASSGELTSILGANGVGKSTLFKCMLGLLPGYTGQILIDGRDIREMSVKELARLVAYIPQMSTSAFNYSVEDIVLMGTTADLSAFRTPGAEELRRADAALERVGICELRHRSFQRISGGERQLAIIARALAQRSNILMLDEPTSALDFGNQMRVLETARELAREGYTVIQTTHDPERAYMFSDKVIALKNGRVLAQGTPAEVLTADNIAAMYGAAVEMTSLYNDKARMFVPNTVFQ